MTPRLRAPREDGSVLSIPALGSVPALVEKNRNAIAGWNYNVQGRQIEVLRQKARAELLEASRLHHADVGCPLPEVNPDSEAPWVVSGHQPELFHAGVWVKNFAAGSLAAHYQTVPFHLIVDNDLPKSASIRVPVRDGSTLRTAQLEFDNLRPELPYQEWRVRDWDLFRSFGTRARELMGSLSPQPILASYWSRAVELAQSNRLIGRAFAGARRAEEQAWGLSAREATLGALCQGDAFRWFASHLLAQLPRFHDIHNESLAAHRRGHHIRSANHPVPNLSREGDWLEAPFWVWRGSSGRRRPLLARQNGRSVELLVAGEREPAGSLPLSPVTDACCAVERLRELEDAGLKIRTRALTTTMFARLFVADLFIHGIGGAKYDELGDLIVRRFFGFEPPSFLTLSMTSWLGLPDEPATGTMLTEVEHTLRELTYNPDRQLSEAERSEHAGLIEEKARWIASSESTRADRKQRWRRLRECNTGMQALVEARRSALLGERDRLRAALAVNEVAHHREFAFVLHDRARLEAAFERGLRPAGSWRAGFSGRSGP